MRDTRIFLPDHIPSYSYQKISTIRTLHMKFFIHTTKTVLIRIAIIILFLVILAGVIAYARGYRFNIREGTITSTGILAISSNPRAAEIWVNEERMGATDSNITLPYGTYDIEIRKEGYTPWSTRVILKGEIVMSINARLFSKNPSLTPLTNLGISQAVPIGTTSQVLIISQTDNPEKDGVYLFEPSAQPIAIFPPLKPLIMASLFPEDTDLRTATFIFSPNHKRAVMTVPNTQETDEEASPRSFLISLDEMNTELFDITTSRDDILKTWGIELNREMLKIAETLPKEIRPIALTSFSLVSLSPDEKKVLYVATQDATLPLVINPPLIGANQQKEERELQKGRVYIYDKQEDKNYPLTPSLVIPIPDEPMETPSPTPWLTLSETTTPQPTPVPMPIVTHEAVRRSVRERIQWYPSSDYIVVREDKKLTLVRYDGTNAVPVYAGPFEPDFFGVLPDWNLTVIINLNTQNNTLGDLYSVGIK